MSYLEDLLAGGAQNPNTFGGAVSGSFPATPREPTAEEIWAQIEAENAAKNAAADRRNATAMTRKPIEPFSFGAPDASTPAVQMALGNAPSPFAGAPTAPFGLGAFPTPVAPPAEQAADASGMPAPTTGAPVMPGPTMGPGSIPPIAAPAAAAVAAATADDEEVPANAKPAQMTNAPMSLAPPAPVAEPSLMDKISAGAKGIAPAMLGIGAALSGDGGATTRAILKEQNDLALTGASNNATAKALALKGVPAEDIQAAMRSPDLMKALISQNYGKDKLQVVTIGTNRQGQEIKGLFNSTTGETKPLLGGTLGQPSKSEIAADAGITGEDFFKTIDNAQDRSLVKQLTQYDLDPAKLSAKGGNRERLLALAGQYDPDFKAALYAPRAAALKEFTSGGANSPASIITNGNTAIQHLGRMSELAAKLGGVNKAWILNGVINWANIKAEDMKNNPDLARYKGAEDRFVEEATKFYRGVGGNKADIDRALNILKPDQSPEARQAAIQEQAELMQSKVNALQDRYKSAVGPSGWKKAIGMAGAEFPIVQQKSAEELDKIRQRASGHSANDAAPKPGNYVWNPQTRTMVPQ